MDKQSNRKKRRSRGEGVTSYRVTSSLSLTDQAYEHQQKAKQRAAQTPVTDPYANTGYHTQTNAQQAPGYYDQQQPAQEGHYDPQAQGYYDQQQPAQEGNYDPQQPVQEGYYDQQNQAYYDQQQPAQEGYYDQQNQAYYDPQQTAQEGYYDPQAQGYYDQQQTAQEGYYDPQAQGYYDQQQTAQEGYYDQQNQGYYDQQQPTQEGYYDPQAQGYYDQQAGQEGYYDPQAQGYYDQQATYEQPPEEIAKRKRKISSVKDYFDDMLGAGHVMATDAEDSPFVPSSESHQTAGPAQPYPPPHLIPQSPLLQLLGPLASFYLRFREKWKFLSAKTGYYADMMLDLQDSIQKEFKEALGLAFKGFLDQLRQKSPLYQQVPAYAGGVPGEQMDPAAMQAAATVYDNPVSFVELHELNVEFTDNYDQPLFDFSRYAHSQYQVSRTVVDPQAMEQALWSIRECAARAGAIPPAQEGPYANIPLPEIMNNITDLDLQAFLQYVKAYPGNYVSRSLKISETFATWVVYGAPSAT